MTIQVTDTQTGAELTVTAVAAELARQDGTELHIAQDAVIRPVLQLEHMVAEAQAWHNVAHRCRKILNGHDVGHEQVAAEPEPVFADLPPDPALQLAPDRLDAEHARVTAAQLERRRRQDELAPVGQRTATIPEPFVPKVPWRIRIKRAVVGYLEQVKREKAMTLSDTGELDVTSEDEL